MNLGNENIIIPRVSTTLLGKAKGEKICRSYRKDNYKKYTIKNVYVNKMMRGNVVFDECGFLSEEMLSVYGAFAIVNKSFRSGIDGNGNMIDSIRLKTIPKEIPNQLFYISSASSTDTKFYALFREFSKRMLMGDKRYFVAVITCDVPLKPTMHGKLMNPLFEKSIIESDLRTNPEKARREYFCQFTTDAGNDAIIKRSVIQRNEEVRKPDLCNPDGKRKYIITYDPARSHDHSVILVEEVYESPLPDGTTEFKGKYVACYNLADIGKKLKTPMRTPEQVEYLKRLIIDYNAGADGYSNILNVYLDGGSGGGAIGISDMLVEPFEIDGITYPGLIDKDYDPEISKRFPDAIDKLRIMQPTRYKSEMYEAMIQMMTQDKISFTAQYDGKDYLTIFDDDLTMLNKAREEIEAKLKKQKLSLEVYREKLDNELSKVQSVKTKQVKLDWMDKIALANLDALKEEVVSMVRIKRESGKDSFELAPEKKNTIKYDDRAYVSCMAAYGLMQERRKSITQRQPKGPSTTDIEKLMKLRPPKRHSRF